MNIMLGSLATDQIEKRLGIDFPCELKDFMSKNRQYEADNIKPGKWHCFDMPFQIQCGDIETAKFIHEQLMDKSSEMNCKLQIGY